MPTRNSVILSARVNRDFARDVQALARARGWSVSQLISELLAYEVRMSGRDIAEYRKRGDGNGDNTVNNDGSE